MTRAVVGTFALHTSSRRRVHDADARGGRYANVTSTLALIVALSGTAYAANTVRSGDIVNGQVKRADLAKDAVTSGKVKDGALLSRLPYPFSYSAVKSSL